MLATNNNQSYSNLYYNYYNPNSSLNNTYNRFKRQRIKNSYVDLANEKRDFISFTINQKELKKFRSLSTTYKTKSQSQTRSINTSLIFKDKIYNPKIKTFFPYSLCQNQNKKNENEKIQIKKQPYSTILRSTSFIHNNDNKNNNNNKQIEDYNNKNNYLINNNKFEYRCNNYNNIKSRQNKIDKRKNNFIGSDIKEKKGENEKFLTSSIKKGLANFFKKDNDNNNSIIIENEKNEKIEEKKNNNIISSFIIDEKENNNDNNNNYENSIKIITDNYIANSKKNFRKKNLEENKNNEKTEYKSKNNKKILNNAIETINGLFEDTLTKIRINKNKNKIQNVKKKLLKKSISCPSINLNTKKEENKNIILGEFNLNEKNLLKENIKKIFEKRKNKNISCSNNNSKYIKTNIYNDNKLKKLLSKIPQHNKDNQRVFKNNQNHIKIIRKNNFNLTQQLKIKKKFKDIMPPNNLEDVLLKKEIYFLKNFN